MPESPKFLLTIDQKEKALDVLRRVYAFNTGQPQEVKMLLFEISEKQFKQIFLELSG